MPRAGAPRLLRPPDSQARRRRAAAGAGRADLAVVDLRVGRRVRLEHALQARQALRRGEPAREATL
jgi:hypothetical protein